MRLRNEKMLCKIIRYESSLVSGDYNMKGLKHKYEIYSCSLSEALENYLKPKLRLSVLKTKDILVPVLNFNESRATVGKLYMAARKLFGDLERYMNVKLHEELRAYTYYKSLYPEIFLDYSFPTVIEWVEGSHKKELETKLGATYKNKPEVVKMVLSLVEEAVSYELRKLGV